MAIFIPEVRPENFNNSLGELQVYEALTALSHQYTIFYSYSWVGMKQERTVGEADFVVLHPAQGLVVIEVKSGEIEYKKGEWIQTNTKTRVAKSIQPFTQARKSQFEILDRVEKSMPRPWPMMCYCVWFPSVEIADNLKLPAEAPREIILDKKSLANPEKEVESVFKYWQTKYHAVSLDSRQFQYLKDTLCPHFHVIPKLKTKIEETEQAYIQLTKQQAALLDFLEEQDIAVIHGLADTGKTVLAVEKARRLAAQGENVLFLCYNSFLRDSLKSSSSTPGVIFHNAHSLAYEIIGDSKTDLDKIIPEFEDFLEEVFDAELWDYKNVIVDEGQDLDDRLLNRLYELVKRKAGCFYVFYDRNQYIMRNQLPKWIDEAECRLVLHRNCRNTAEVFNVSCNLMGVRKILCNDIHGEIPSLTLCSSDRDMEIVVEDFLNYVEKEGLLAEDIAILSAKTVEDSWINPERKYGKFELSLKRAPGKVLFTTIRKFKGLEADAILIVDASMYALLKEENRRLLYVGTSRAKNYLNIAMLDDVANEDMGEFLGNLAPGRNMPKNKKGFKRLLGLN